MGGAADVNRPLRRSQENLSSFNIVPRGWGSTNSLPRQKVHFDWPGSGGGGGGGWGGDKHLKPAGSFTNGSNSSLSRFRSVL